ncbi:proline dehydrogenase family protein [Sulfurospirillum arcachonense]|uniref:proline dehydrogenase family protein n=1 Tax=Sulfurospirillum arcachonense TaxID=57666 RepID=UPI0004682019|nr:bifunctional proline dehydrogenase/L-glutamate gamma-semialdehyde dehydrogenase [Sulfurospirillum arcachonense]
MENNEIVMNRSIDLAEKWQKRATEKISDFEKNFHKKMQKMFARPMDKVLLIDLMDQSFRTKNNSRVADQVEYIFTKYGMATFFTTPEKFLIFLFRNIGIYLPDISVPLFIKSVRDDTDTVVLKGEDKLLNAHLQKRKSEGTRVNLNMIGEVVLGEEEAQERIEKYVNILENPNIDYMSIKISTLFSQINPVSYENTVDEFVERLSKIFAQAKKYSFTNVKGELENKFINLDMEEYRDLSLTFETFIRVLEKPEFKDFKAGIVLQAYLPDSHLWQVKLTDWAKERVKNGGAPIKIRLVKGANMEMEETEAGLRHWETCPYTKKLDTDSNYKIMLEYALQPENAPYVNLGVASHNLFELAYGYETAKANNVIEYFSMEMLEGMSESARVAIKELSGEVILYGPAAKKEQFTNAIAYLVRRFDENTGTENFIRYSFGLEAGSADWEMLKEQFIASFENKKNIFIGAKRKQDRLTENWDNFKGSSFETKEYHGEADTDFILPPNKQWAKDIRTKWMKKAGEEVATAPVIIGGVDLIDKRDIKEVKDKSQLKEGVICGKYAVPTAEDLKKAVEVAKADPDGWRSATHEYRHEMLCKVANEVRKKRADLIGIASAEVGKIITETDVEVSEAIDFLEFYAHSIDHFSQYKNLKFKGRGVGVITPPWNFPVAIPVGGISAALAAGNTVIVKPASVAALCAYELCKCYWDAGISKNVLQYAPAPGALAGKHLIENPDVDFVILTGGEDTAYSMLEARPNLYLTAETGGKDATIVTAMSDREQAIKNVIASAFNNSGQKCSATSLLVLEEEVYNDPSFKSALKDAAASVEVGSVWNYVNRIGTLANPVSGNLKKAIETLEPGEEWLLKPTYAEDNEYMLKPAIKWGVKEGSFCHMNELFGPVLSVMKAKDLKHAIDIVNQTGYGLTSGIESLDARETDYWRENLNAGNLYINRGTTGAIVLRQPFGGMGKSAIGAGRKAGVYSYVTQFMDFEEVSVPKVDKKHFHPLVDIVDAWKKETNKGIHVAFKNEFSKIESALQSYLKNYKEEFDVEHDYFKLRGEDNVFRYLPLDKVAVRVSESDTLFEVLGRIMAARVSGVSLHVSIDATVENNVVSFIYENKDTLLKSTDVLIRENENEFVQCFSNVDRIIYSDISKVSDFVFAEAAKLAKFIVRGQTMMEGRLELLNYFQEQSISHSYHRYGNIGVRALEK